ncbi:unnamed protein product [Soboliphyme baturini]|uniref:Zgc: n=1 Tax=Soboliphyme baturini TaxID=241478 RepID=A0A183J236_9BILA|nr:unnamed protein product [Soboliphyme baturini]
MDLGSDEFLDMLAGMQSRRMDDQRVSLPYLPGLQHPARVLGPHLMKRRSRESVDVMSDHKDSAQSAESRQSDVERHLTDEFYEGLMRCQV